MSLKVTQVLLVLCAAAAGVSPVWGGMAWLAAWIALVAGTWSRTRRARAVLRTHLGLLGEQPPEVTRWALRHALAYVWPSSAKDWGDTWQMSGLLALLLVPAALPHALFRRDFGYLGFVVPLALQLSIGVRVAFHLKVGERVKEGEPTPERALHEALATKLHLHAALGKWPPEPSPDAAP
jgi:hypothetical protein